MPPTINDSTPKEFYGFTEEVLHFLQMPGLANIKVVGKDEELFIKTYDPKRRFIPSNESSRVGTMAQGLQKESPANLEAISGNQNSQPLSVVTRQLPVEQNATKSERSRNIAQKSAEEIMDSDKVVILGNGFDNDRAKDDDFIPSGSDHEG